MGALKLPLAGHWRLLYSQKTDLWIRIRLLFADAEKKQLLDWASEKDLLEPPSVPTWCSSMFLGSLYPWWEIWSKIPHTSPTSCSQTSLDGKQEHIKPRALWLCALVWTWDVATEQHMTWHPRSAYASATWGAAQVIWTGGGLSLRAEPNKDRRLVSGKSGAEIKHNGSFCFSKQCRQVNVSSMCGSCLQLLHSTPLC